jgi:eukaryotic-like serine/threonine-protein kinase
MKECPVCYRSYSEDNAFCSRDGSKLVMAGGVRSSVRRATGSLAPPGPDVADNYTPPEAGLPVRLTIVDADDEGHKSHTITGKMIDMSMQGMHVQTNAVESDSLNIIKDHTIAFKNRLDIEIDLPAGTICLEGFAVWYKPAPDGRNWNVGIYIKDMPPDDRDRYEAFLEETEN